MQINRKRNGAWRHTERDVIVAISVLKCSSSRDIGEAIGVSYKWVEDKIRILRKSNRIFISDWRKISVAGDWRRYYSIRDDEQDDEPKPRPVSGAEKARNYQRRKAFLRRMLHESSEQSSSDLS